MNKEAQKMSKLRWSKPDAKKIQGEKSKKFWSKKIAPKMPKVLFWPKRPVYRPFFLFNKGYIAQIKSTQ